MFNFLISSFVDKECEGRALGPTLYLVQGWVREGMQSHPFMIVITNFSCGLRPVGSNLFSHVSGDLIPIPWFIIEGKVKFFSFKTLQCEEM